MEELDYREVMYRLEKVLEKKNWSEQAKNNIRNMIKQIIENNGDYIEVVGKEEKVNKKKYISDLLNGIEKDIAKIKIFNGDLQILDSETILYGLNVKEDDKYNVYVKTVEAVNTPLILQHEIGHRKRNTNVLGVRLGEVIIKKVFNEAIAVESENKIWDVEDREEYKKGENYYYYAINKQLHYMIGEMLYDENEVDLVGDSIKYVENQYSAGKSLQNYWQSLISIISKSR